MYKIMTEALNSTQMITGLGYTRGNTSVGIKE
jgi:hypothetical protein